MQITGVIYKIDFTRRLLAMREKNHIEYYYLQNNLIRKFQKYLYKGRFITIEFEEKKTNYHGINARKVNHFVKIIRNCHRRQEIYYDIDVIKEGIVELINRLDNLMFLDLEMSMHDFDVDKNFKSEIIQAGFIIADKNGNELETYSTYIKPTAFPHITKRTKKFLGITDEDLEEGITYKEFYQNFSFFLTKYNPTILVWGKNDIIILKDSYTLNEMPSLSENHTIINLLQIQKNFFNLKNDLGLFNALKIYSGSDYEQIHDALEDARVTKDVFFLFKNIINNKPGFHFPSL